MNDNDDGNDSKTDKVSGNYSDSHCGNSNGNYNSKG